MDANTLVHELLAQCRYPNRNELIRLLTEASCLYPIQYEAGLKLLEKFYKNFRRVNLSRLSILELIKTTECFCASFIEEERKEYPNMFSSKAMRKIYYRESDFEVTTRLSNDRYDKFQVSDLLEITGYALNFSHAFLGVDTTKYGEGLLVLKGVDLALRNQPHNKPDIKKTHLAVDVISELAKKMTHDPDLQRCISGGAVIAQLAIRFFTRA